jgi:hypothetical protein
MRQPSLSFRKSLWIGYLLTGHRVRPPDSETDSGGCLYNLYTTSAGHASCAYGRLESLLSRPHFGNLDVRQQRRPRSRERSPSRGSARRRCPGSSVSVDSGTFLPQSPVSGFFGKKVGRSRLEAKIANARGDIRCALGQASTWPDFLATGLGRLARTKRASSGLPLSGNKCEYAVSMWMFYGRAQKQYGATICRQYSQLSPRPKKASH